MRMIVALLLLLLLAACGGGAIEPAAPATAVPATAVPATAVPAATAAPILALETATLPLGDVPNGDIVARDVVVRNTGGAPLVVESVITSCGCTTATLDPMTIPPNATATLHITFDAGAHGPDLRGELLRQVTLLSNDPAQPEATVELTANITDPGS